jgi:hypothetical protein
MAQAMAGHESKARKGPLRRRTTMSFFREPPFGTAPGSPLSETAVDSAWVAEAREGWSSTDFCRHILGAARGEPGSIEALAAYFAHEPEGVCTPLRHEDSFAGARVFGLFADDLVGYRLAMATLLALPASPPGPDISSPRASPANVASRHAAPSTDPVMHSETRSLSSFYQQLMRLRSGDGALASLGYDNASLRGKVLSFTRRNGQACALVVLNYGDPAPVSLAGLPPRTAFTPLLSTDPGVLVSDAGGRLGLSLPARSVQIYAC